MTDFNDFKKQYHLNLNPQQEVAVKEINGPILLLAVPGSGKTTVIVARIGNMILNCNISPKNILTLTFSVASARDMGERFAKVFGDSLRSEVEFKTIHSVCVSVIKTYEKRFGKTAFTLEPAVSKIITLLYRELKNEYPGENEVQEITRHITYCKNMMLDEAKIKEIEIPDLNFFEFFIRYEKYKRECKIMDFDDQLKYAYEILKSYPEILEKFHQTYRYINVDEAQDTSLIQHKIIEQLAQKHKNIFMVGDEDQSIYGFRGAFPKALLQMEESYENAQVLFMQTNYRCSNQITKAANLFIAQNRERRPKNMTTINEDGEPLKHTVISHRSEQYEYILQQMKIAREKGYSSIAVIYRNNESCVPLMDYFQRNHAPFFIKENNRTFFSHFIVKDMKAFIRLGENLKDINSFMQIYYKLGIGISKNFAEKLWKIAPLEDDILTTVAKEEGILPWQKEKSEDLSKKIKKLQEKKPSQGIRFILNELGYASYLLGRAKEGFSIQSFDQKVDTLMVLADRCVDQNEFLERLDFLEKYVPEGKSSVSFVTMHASKGLEYDKVFLIDALEGKFPYEKPRGDLLLGSDYEEEVRLFYVGATRAKKELEFISYKNRYQGDCGCSMFIESMMSAQTPAMLMHKVFGQGRVIQKSKDFITVDFKEFGEKILSLQVCKDNRLTNHTNFM